jgi:hypothetical protein
MSGTERAVAAGRDGAAGLAEKEREGEDMKLTWKKSVWPKGTTGERG